MSRHLLPAQAVRHPHRNRAPPLHHRPRQTPDTRAFPNTGATPLPHTQNRRKKTQNPQEWVNMHTRPLRHQPRRRVQPPRNPLRHKVRDGFVPPQRLRRTRPPLSERGILERRLTLPHPRPRRQIHRRCENRRLVVPDRPRHPNQRPRYRRAKLRSPPPHHLKQKQIYQRQPLRPVPNLRPLRTRDKTAQRNRQPPNTAAPDPGVPLSHSTSPLVTAPGPKARSPDTPSHSAAPKAAAPSI